MNAKVGDTFTQGILKFTVLTENGNSGTVSVGAAGIKLNSSYNYVSWKWDIPETAKNGNTVYGVTEIADSAFYYCINITGNLAIPKSVVTIGNYAFFHCIGIADTLNIPNSVTNIGDWAFGECSGLTGVKIPNSVKTIGKGAFDGLWRLKSIEIPNSVTSIGNQALAHCTGLVNVKLSDSITTIGRYTFSNCTGLTQVVIPNSVTSIGNYAFWRCRELSGELIIPDSVKSIGEGAFSGCEKLTNIKIPNSVTSIGSDMLDGCKGLTHICYPSHADIMSGTQSNKTSEITIPFSACNNNLGYFNSGSGTKSLFLMGNGIPSNRDFLLSELEHTYVKPSVYEKFKNYTAYKSFHLSDSIPVTFPANKKYVTLCRDFDVDLRHVNDNLPAGIEPLKAYIVDDADGDLKMVFMDEIKYIPSRLKANVEGYKGMDEYVGVVLKGTPGYTYYYQMGEEDYSKGADGQMTLEKAKALSASVTTSSAAKAMVARTASTAAATLVGAPDPNSVQTEKTVDGITYKTYGLKNGAFEEYSKDGVIPYNKAYLRIPISTTASLAKPMVTMQFNNADGTTAIEKVTLDDPTLGKMAEDAMYSIDGTRVDDSYHGIVIVNGKKYFKK